MPGIFGIVEKQGQAAGADRAPHGCALQVMAAAMQYESFYTSTRYESKDLGVYAGWVGRIDQAKLHGPVVSAERGVSLFLSGEPYAEPIGDVELEHQCRRDGREGVRIINQYLVSGEQITDKLSGLFAAFLIDERQEQSLLFNDRFGMERLFVYEDEQKLLFSSEAKAILAAVPETRSLDPVGVAQLLTCGCSFGERSLFRNIRVLPPGTVLTCRRGRTPYTRTYFDRTVWEDADPLSERDFLAGFGDTLQSVIARHAQQPPEVAVSLTGGLDSRMIMASLAARKTSVRCYTFGGMYRESYDVRVARRVAEACDQPHSVIALAEDFVQSAPQHLERAVFISDGYMGLSGAAELYLNRLARQVAPVRITGNYGGELLRGFRAFKASVPQGDFLNRDFMAHVEHAIGDFSSLDKMPPVSFTLFRLAPSGYGRYAIERSQVSVRSPFLDDRLAPLLYRIPGRFTQVPEPSIALIAQWHHALLKIPTDRGLLGRGGAVTTRARRLHREALFKAEYWTGHGAPHWIAKATRYRAGAWMESLFRGRHKFQHPRRWLRTHFTEYARETLRLEAASCDSFFDSARVQMMLDAHLSGQANYCDELDKLLTIAVTSRRLLTQS